MTSSVISHLEFRDLCYFQAVAETGHVGNAAELVHLSQPALTKAMHRLEEIFGVALFERKGRRIQITPAGQLLYQ